MARTNNDEYPIQPDGMRLESPPTPDGTRVAGRLKLSRTSCKDPPNLLEAILWVMKLGKSARTCYLLVIGTELRL
jgi:hypothetical protein